MIIHFRYKIDMTDAVSTLSWVTFFRWSKAAKKVYMEIKTKDKSLSVQLGTTLQCDIRDLYFSDTLENLHSKKTSCMTLNCRDFVFSGPHTTFNIRSFFQQKSRNTLHGFATFSLQENFCVTGSIIQKNFEMDTWISWTALWY